MLNAIRIFYTYDTRGNILSKTYSLDDTVVDTINYGYGDGARADVLTSFDGNDILYTDPETGVDEVFNPAVWYNGARPSS